MSYPNLQVVLTSSLVGAWLAVRFNSNTQQLFSFAAITGIVSNWKGYENEDFPIPKYGLAIAGALAGYLATHPIMGYVKVSIVIGSLAYPTYIVYKEIGDFSKAVNDKTSLIISLLNPFDG